MNEDQRREFLLVTGGSPLARQIIERLDDPEVQERMRQGFAEFARGINAWVESLRPAFIRLGEAATAAVQALREAGLLDEQPPTDPQARPLWLRQHRSTGPDRQIQHQRRTDRKASA